MRARQGLRLPPTAGALTGSFHAPRSFLRLNELNRWMPLPSNLRRSIQADAPENVGGLALAAREKSTTSAKLLSVQELSSRPWESSTKLSGKAASKSGAS